MERLLSKLKAHNIDVKVDDGNLKLQIPDGLDAGDIIAEVRDSKKELIAYITGLLNKDVNFNTIPKAPEQSHYPLSSAQKRLYLWQQMNLDSTVYNTTCIIPLKIGTDKERVKRVLEKLVARHDCFRTCFEMLEGNPVQRIYEHIDFDLEICPVKELADEGIVKQFIKPFDLAKAPLLRAAILMAEEGSSKLILHMHHIISDGVSQTILEQEFQQLDSGEVLPPLRLQYKDYSVWQNSEAQQSRFKEQEKYWLKAYEGEVPTLNLPEDFTRPAIKSYVGASVNFTLSREETRNVKSLAENNDLTLYMSLLSVFTILLSKLSGQEDIIVGAPIAGRNHPDLQGIVGMFVNTLAIRNEVKGGDTLQGYLLRLKQNTLDAYANQDYQFEELVNRLSTGRDLSRNPIFSVVFNQLNLKEHPLPAAGEDSYKHTQGASKFDINLAALDLADRIFFVFEYSTSLYRSETIDRFIRYFKLIARQVGGAQERKISEIEIVSEEEKRQLLSDFNDTNAVYPRDKTVAQLFEQQVARTPGNTSLKLGGNTLTYHELNRRANGIANKLRELNVRPDDIVGVFLDRSLETVASMLGILKAAGAYLPLDPDYPEERLNFIVKDSCAKVVITAEGLSNRIAFSGDTLHVEDISFDFSDSDRLETINNPSDLCYIIYTSGTTGNPKGVMVEHRNVVRLFFNDKFQFDFSEKDVWTMFHSHCFDFSVWEMYGALLYGGKLIIVPKLAARDVAEYFSILKNERVTILNQTPSAFYNLAEIALSTPEKSLTDLRYVIFGGEALKPDKLKEWFTAYSDVKLINMFGITETTVHVTYKEIGVYEIENNISNIGAPIPTLSTYIVDKDLRLVPIGVAGELLVGGAGVSRGYLGREDLTKEKFIKNPYNPEERLYRSGDMVRMLPNGEMVYLRRMDAQVQLRGFRIELGEIENQLLKYPEIKECVVISREREAGYIYLCCYYVSARILDHMNIRTYLSKVLPEYMIPSYFVYLNELPLTANKKLDSRALPEPELKAGDDYVPPRNKMEEDIAGIWAEVLKVEKVGIDSNYFSLGGDSITALRLISIVNKRLNAGASLSDLFINQTIRQFSQRISSSGLNPSIADGIDKIKKGLEAEKKRILSDDLIGHKENVEDIYPATDIQAGMIFHYLRSPGVYHDQMVHVVRYPVLDTGLFDRALACMVGKHSILRTTFLHDENRLYQVILKEIRTKIKHHDISGRSPSEQHDFISNLLRSDKKNPFDISEPLWRFYTFNLGNNSYCVCFVCHHAIIDGWSDASFNTELNNIYLALLDDPTFTPSLLKSCYKDFVIDQMRVSENGALAEFWRNELEGYVRFTFGLAGKDVRSKEKSEILPDDLHAGLIYLSKQLNVSVKNICFSAFMYTLKMFSYTNDITIGLITNNRPAIEDGDKILGCFLNTVPVRVLIPENKTWQGYICGINDKLNRLKEYDKVSLLKIVELTGEVSTNQNPITDIIFNYVDFHVYDELRANELAHSSGGSGGARRLSEAGGVQSNSLFAFNVNASRGKLAYGLSYITSFIGEECANDFFGYFKTILAEISKNPDGLISCNSIIPRVDLNKVLYDFNRTKREYPKEKTIHHLFEEQVRVSSADLALKTKEKAYTYQELNEAANRVANCLKDRDIKDEQLIGLITGRSPEMIIGILGILKAGGAYVPIDPEYPNERVNFIVKDSGINILLSARGIKNEFGFPGEIILMDGEEVRNACVNDSAIKGDSQNLAYVMYTSGSTGQPKGVEIEHKSVIRLVKGNDFFPFNNDQRILQTGAPVFDATTFEIWGALLNGGSLYIADNYTLTNAQLLGDYIRDNSITTIWLTSSLFNQLVDQDSGIFEPLRFLLVGGDVLSTKHVNKVRKENKDLVIINGYGPTENTTFSTTFSIEKEYDGSIPIGKPISNSTAYIFDNGNNVQPIGVRGELLVGGDGLARRYLNNEDLTRTKFITHPFIEGERLYRTGDLARWLPDGNIEFLGRIDHQVKIRGFRIELGEVENAVLRHENVREAVVLAREENGDKYLCAYIVCEDALSKEELRDYLATQLPNYMIPSYFVKLDEFPLTPNGKVNHKALPIPEIKAGDDYVAPSNEIEEKLVKIWSEILNIAPEEISITSDFFVIGGHSLNAMMLVSRINKEFNIKILLGKLFENPTISNIGMMIFNLSDLEKVVDDIEI